MMTNSDELGLPGSNQAYQQLWTIGSPDGRSPDLVDNYKEPGRLGNVVWRVSPEGGASGQQWPLFHPSEADPEGGYSLYPYTIYFHLETEPADAYRLRLHYLVIAPRISSLEVQVNGVSGWVYLHPTPSPTAEIRLLSGLHTTIYADGVAEVIIPGALLRRGENCLVFISHDGAPITRFSNPEKIKRLDRMATGAGFIYQAITFSRLAEAPTAALARLLIQPSVVYQWDEDGRLVERCHLFAELNHSLNETHWTLLLAHDNGTQRLDFPLPAVPFGHIHHSFSLLDGEGPVRCTLRTTVNGETAEYSQQVQRRRKWQVYITPHAHTDIGFTHRQWEVAERLCRNLDAALALLNQAATASAFAYHLDATWTLETYLATRDEATIQALVDQVRAGRIGLPANYAILLTHFAALEDLVRNQEMSETLLRPLGLRGDYAAVVDVPSLSSALPAVLAGCGVRYLVHAANQDRGPFRVNGRLHRLSPFYWQGVSGGRVLVWLAKMYCELRKVCGSPPDLSTAERGLELWLDEYETETYVPDAVLLYGQEADNTDLDPQPADFVRRWNETYAYPRLIPSNVTSFFEYVEGRGSREEALLSTTTPLPAASPPQTSRREEALLSTTTPLPAASPPQTSRREEALLSTTTPFPAASPPQTSRREEALLSTMTPSPAASPPQTSSQEEALLATTTPFPAASPPQTSSQEEALLSTTTPLPAASPPQTSSQEEALLSTTTPSPAASPSQTSSREEALLSTTTPSPAASSLQTVRGDGGAYWEDGVGSTIAATIQARQAQATLPAAERLAALAVLHHTGYAYPQAQFDDAWRQLLLFVEHTWGAFLSGQDPDALLQQDQWAVKAHMAADAAQWAARLLHSAATRHSLSWNTDGREVVVYNPHSWPVSGPVVVEIGRTETLHDPVSGAAVPTRVVRTLNTQAWVEVWLEQLEGLSYRRFLLRETGRGTAEPVRATPISQDTIRLENEHYRLVVAVRRGCVTSWFDKALNRELVDQADEWGFGQFLYASGGEGTRLISNQADLPDSQLTIDHTFTLLDHSLAQDELGVSLKLTGTVAAGRLEIEWRLSHRAKQVDVHYTYHKAERLTKEAAYIAFPLALPGANISSDAQLGWVEWQRDQLPGGCKEWLPLQTGILVEGGGETPSAVLIASPDIPLFCVGDVVRGRWPTALDLTGGRIFSYVLNNYWQVNYKASQGGKISFCYRLTSDEAIPRDHAFRFGWQARRPLVAQRLSLQEFRQVESPYDGANGGCLARVTPAQVVVTTLKRARWADGFILRLQEIGGQARVAAVAIPGRPIRRAWTTDLLEREEQALTIMPDGTLRVTVPAWGLATVRIEVEQ